MKTLNALLLLLFAVLFASCSPSQKVTNSWSNKQAAKSEKYKKVFVFAITQNLAARNLVESDLRRSIIGLGLDAETSYDVFPATFTKDTAPSKEVILAKLRELKCDLIFTVSLLDSKTESKYVPGSTSYYAPYPAYGYYGGFGSYYGYYSPVVYSPGYYTTDKIYYLEANLFDAESESILWSVQSETYNPENLQEFSAEYTDLIISQAKVDGIIRK
jgi:hypothetical protein